MSNETKQIYKDVWITTAPDNDEYSEDGMTLAIQKVAEKVNIKYTWMGKTRDTGFGQEKLYQLDGYESDINDFLADVYDWAVDMTERGVSAMVKRLCGYCGQETDHRVVEEWVLDISSKTGKKKLKTYLCQVCNPHGAKFQGRR